MIKYQRERQQKEKELRKHLWPQIRPSQVQKAIGAGVEAGLPLSLVVSWRSCTSTVYCTDLVFCLPWWMSLWPSLLFFWHTTASPHSLPTLVGGLCAYVWCGGGERESVFGVCAVKVRNTYHNTSVYVKIYQHNLNHCNRHACGCHTKTHMADWWNVCTHDFNRSCSVNSYSRELHKGVLSTYKQCALSSNTELVLVQWHSYREYYMYSLLW